MNDRSSLRPRARGASPARLIVLPVIALLATLAVCWHSIDQEPFFVLSLDAVLFQVGGPLVIGALWGWWFVLAHQKRLELPIVAVVACWATLNIWVAGWFLVSFFQEPWRGG